MACVITTGVPAQQAFREVESKKEQTTFSMFAPSSANQVKLRLYRKGDGGKAVRTVSMSRTGNDRWSAVVKGDQKGMF